VRRFNRFYTRAIGVLDRGHLGTAMTLAESRVLYEIASRDGTTARAVIAATGLDGGYLSRIVQRFERAGLTRRTPSPEDGRSFVLTATEAGRAAYAALHEKTEALVEGLVAPLAAPERARLTAALGEVEGLLHAPAPAEVILRPHRAGDLGWVVQRHGELYAREQGWDERFEAMCAEIVGQFVANFDPARERSWIAERGGARVGCVFLQKADEGTAKLRLLLVEPSARGLGLGRRLVGECVAAARELGYREITLWTQDVLVSARRLYAAAGFECVDRWPNRDFGGFGVTSEKWRLAL
jgi:DNA-binding MarR family transcriptional regulator/predicted N-acetyltransferase YhbS